MEDLVKVCKALADGKRIRILKMLQKRPLCVCEITAILGLAQSSVSRHLKLLKEAGLIDDNRQGLWIEYKLARHKTNKYSDIILALLLHWLEDDPKILKDSGKINKVNREKIYKSKRCVSR